MLQSNHGSDAGVIKALELAVGDGVQVLNYSFAHRDFVFSYSALSLALNHAALVHNILFCKAANNSGPWARRIGGQVPSQTFVVGNTSYAAALNVDIAIADSTFRSRLVYTDLSTTIMPKLDSNNKLAAWHLEKKDAQGDLLYSPDSNHAYDFFIMPQRDGDGMPGFAGMGTGSAADWDALPNPSDAEGKVVVLARGSETIATIINLAATKGVAALLFVNPVTGGIALNTWNVNNSQMVGTYVPTFAIGNADGLALVEALKNNANKAVFASFNGDGLYILNSSSSRGPISDNYTISPNITGPGTSIWSTVPWSSTGYSSMTGTSMSSPFMAGLCALVLSKDFEDNGRFTLRPVDVKALLTNSANKDIFSSSNYAVNEIGAGSPHISKSLNATSWVTVNRDVYVMASDQWHDINFKTVPGEVTDFSFLSSYVGAKAESRTLTANLYNKADTAKTFGISYVLQTTADNATQFINSNGNITPTFSANTVTVGAGSSGYPVKATFDVTLNIPELAAEDKGSHEGYIILTNVADASEVYHLPWAIIVERPQPDWYLEGEETGIYTLKTFRDLYELSDIVRGAGGMFDSVTPQEAPGFQDSFKGKTVVLGADIEITLATGGAAAIWGTAARSLGWFHAVGTFEFPFMGTFDGNGYTISYKRSPAGLSGLYTVFMNNQAQEYRGVLGHVLDATIKNVKIAECTVWTYARSSPIVGMASVSPGGQTLIENCENKATVLGYYQHEGPLDFEHGGFVGTQVGGIVGLANVADGGVLTIKDCVNYGDVSGTSEIGGILGGTMAAVVAPEAVTGALPPASTATGTVDLVNCTNYGNISHYLAYGISGGIAGSFTAGDGFTSLMTDVRNYGSVTGAINRESLASFNDLFNATGGIVGYAQNAMIQNATNYGVVLNEQPLSSDLYRADRFSGGIVGYAMNSALIDNYNIATVKGSDVGTGQATVAGILGFSQDTLVEGNVNFADIISPHLGFSIVGVDQGSELSNNYTYWKAKINEYVVSEHVNNGTLMSSAGIFDAMPATLAAFDASQVKAISFLAPDRRLLYTQVVLAGDTIDQELLNEYVSFPYKFVNWLLDGEPYDLDTVVNSDLELMALLLVNVIPTAKVTKLNGNTNDLHITITEEYSNGYRSVTTKTFSIRNNAADIYSIATNNLCETNSYKVYVDTKGNDQIRACFIVD